MKLDNALPKGHHPSVFLILLRRKESAAQILLFLFSLGITFRVLNVFPVAPSELSEMAITASSPLGY